MEEVGYYTYFTDKISVIHNHSQVVKKNIDTLRILELYNNSTYYYYSNYKKASALILFFSKVNFSIFESLYKLKHHFSRGES